VGGCGVFGCAVRFHVFLCACGVCGWVRLGALCACGVCCVWLWVGVCVWVCAGVDFLPYLPPPTPPPTSHPHPPHTSRPHLPHTPTHPPAAGLLPGADVEGGRRLLTLSFNHIHALQPAHFTTYTPYSLHTLPHTRLTACTLYHIHALQPAHFTTYTPYSPYLQSRHPAASLLLPPRRHMHVRPIR
jgi:hypothetical protein